MTQLLYFLGFITLILIPFMTYIFIVPKLKDKNHRDIVPILSVIPSILIFIVVLYFKQDLPMERSQNCGEIKSYQVHKTRGGHFERISIRFDQAKYNRHLIFNDTLERKPIGAKVCFEFYDRFKNKDATESTLLKWIDP